MNSRRPKPSKPASSRYKPTKVGPEAIPAMGPSPSPPPAVYCCVAEGPRIVYSYCGGGGGRELVALAARCLEAAPPLHRWCSHTAGTRTFCFLMAGDLTYFAVADPTPGTEGVLRLLERVRNVFDEIPKRDLDDVMEPIVGQFITSLDTMPRTAALAWDTFHGVANYGDGVKASSSSSLCKGSKPLPARDNTSNDKGKWKEKVDGITTNVNEPIDRGAGRSLSSPRIHRSQSGWSLWWWHARIVMAADLLICMVLFCIWLAFCRGFKCISR